MPALAHGAVGSLRALARAYFVTEVAGQAPATIEAKRRDLSRFIGFYEKLYVHDDPAEWYVSITREFLKQLARGRPSQATIASIYASVRHFARWIHRKVRPFPLGCPTDGIKPPQEPEPEWKGLSRADEIRLLSAAQTLRLRPGRGTNQGLRDHAAIAVLLGSGLRVSELLGIKREQYDGRGFEHVIVKGSHIRDFVPVHKQARKVLEEWLRASDGQNPKAPIFTTRTGKALTRHQLFEICVLSASVREELRHGAVKYAPYFQDGRMAHDRTGSDAATHQALAQQTCTVHTDAGGTVGRGR